MAYFARFLDDLSGHTCLTQKFTTSHNLCGFYTYFSYSSKKKLVKLTVGIFIVDNINITFVISRYDYLEKRIIWLLFGATRYILYEVPT